jgi:hypothetical protein
VSSVEVLAVDRDLLRRTFPDVPDADLIERALNRGMAIVGGAFDAGEPEEMPSPEQVVRLRRALALAAARVAMHRFELVTNRARLSRAEWDEQESYERHLQLHKDVVPPLKLEAEALRAQVRRLENEARGLGIDVEALEPSIDWASTVYSMSTRLPRTRRTRAARRPRWSSSGACGRNDHHDDLPGPPRPDRIERARPVPEAARPTAR